MNKPEIASAALRRDPPPETGLAPLQLRLSVSDPEVRAELLQRTEGPQRDEYALTALRVGVLALRQAGGMVDAQRIRSEGERLVEAVDGRLREHAASLNKTLEKELKAYFDPSSGHFPQRVQDLVGEKGKLTQVLMEHVAGDNSALARQLAAAVGKDSPLMKHLSPRQQDGLVDTITRLAEEKLEAQGRKLLGEFDLNNENGALKRLISQIETNLDFGNPKAGMGMLREALAKTQEQIRKDLTLDEKDSALKRLHESLRSQLADFAEKQAVFQQALSEQLGIRQVQARTTEGGFGFEHLAAAAIQDRVQALQDEFASVGEVSGALKRKTGDHVQTLGAESAAPGACIVYECKRDKSYRVKAALEELDQARRNREADVGVFVMSAATLRENPSLQAEYPRTLQRYGERDIIVVWDDADPSTNVCLDVAVSLARALVMRTRKQQAAPELAADLKEMTDAITDMEKQLERFEALGKTCDSIVKGAENIKDELSKIAKRIVIDTRRLNENVDALSQGR